MSIIRHRHPHLLAPMASERVGGRGCGAVEVGEKGDNQPGEEVGRGHPPLLKDRAKRCPPPSNFLRPPI